MQTHQKSDRDNRPLRVLILPAYLVAHQIHSLKLCAWLMELFGKCSGFRALFFEVLCDVDKVKTCLDSGNEISFDLLLASKICMHYLC